VSPQKRQVLPSKKKRTEPGNLFAHSTSLSGFKGIKGAQGFSALNTIFLIDSLGLEPSPDASGNVIAEMSK
jgi:hypothetical protein